MEKGSTYAYVFLTCIVGIAFWIALAASVDMDYAITHVTFADAIAKAARTPIATVVHDDFARDYLRFLGSVVLTIATVFMPRPSFRIGTVVIAIAVSLPAGALVTPMLAIAFPFYLFTGSDGETWGEAWPTMSAVGFWVVVSVGYVVIQWVCHRKQMRSSPNQASQFTSLRAETER